MGLLNQEGNLGNKPEIVIGKMHHKTMEDISNSLRCLEGDKSEEIDRFKAEMAFGVELLISNQDKPKKILTGKDGDIELLSRKKKLVKTKLANNSSGNSKDKFHEILD